MRDIPRIELLFMVAVVLVVAALWACGPREADPLEPLPAETAKPDTDRAPATDRGDADLTGRCRVRDIVPPDPCAQIYLCADKTWSCVEEESS